LSHTKNGFPSLCCCLIKSLAAKTNSSSQGSIRSLVSGPVSSIFCLPTFPHRGILVGSSLHVVEEWITPRGPNLSKNFGNSFFECSFPFHFWLFFRIEVIKIAKELVKSMIGGQHMTEICQMVPASIILFLQ
jgi:hypothetical protein